MEKEITKEMKNALGAMYDARNKAFKLYLDFVKQVIDEVDTITFDHSNYDEEYVAIAYDGGNHPEYASNMYSTVYSIAKHIYDGASGTTYTHYLVECEDGNMDLEYVGIDDIVALADAIEFHLSVEHEEQEEMEG